MKISELIEKLSDIKDRHGDLTVCVQHRDDGGAYDTFEVLEDLSLYLDEKRSTGTLKKVLMI